MPVERQRPTHWWWVGGHVLDVVHLPAVLALVVIGWPVLGGPLFTATLTAVVIVQLAFLGCPCVALSTWMKRHHRPDHAGHWSFTVWLYERHGPTVAVPVFVVLFTLGATFAAVL